MKGRAGYSSRVAALRASAAAGLALVLVAGGCGGTTATGGTSTGGGSGSATTTTARGDSTPPRFGGITDISTKGAGAAISFVILTWKPASDDRTPEDKIVYDIYTASTPGGENFKHPTATTPPGSTFYRAICAHKYYVVRARDQGGNVDSNTVEKHLPSCPL